MDGYMMVSDPNVHCPIYLDLDIVPETTLSETRQQLEHSSNSKKVKALEQTILLLLRGEDVSSLLMTIIRFVLPSNHHRLKKLVHLFFQIFDLRKPDGTVLDESILVCNALRNDLCSPNEYVRGSALRLLSKMRHWNIVHPMISSILENLKHGEPYVHKNALLCLAAICKSFGTQKVEGCLAHIERILLGEGAAAAKVKAFKLLEISDPAMAAQYILSIEGTLLNFPPNLKLAILSSFFVISAIDPQIRTLLLRITVMLLENTQNNSVRFAGGCIISRLKSAPVECRRAAASAFVKLLLESDLNVKLIVLSKLNKLYARSTTLGDVPNVVELHVMDLLRAMSATSRQVTLGAISLVLRCLGPHNVDDLMQSFKREFKKVEEMQTHSPEQASQFRALLIRAIRHTCGLYPQACGVVYDMLLDYLCHSQDKTAVDIALFFKHLTEITPHTRNDTISRLIKMLDNISQANILTICFWIIGEYTSDVAVATLCIDTIHSLLAPYPLVAVPSKDVADEQNEEGHRIEAVTTVVLEDGTYGAHITEVHEQEQTGLRKVVMCECDLLLYSSLAQCMLKLASLVQQQGATAKAALIVGNLVQIMQQPEHATVYCRRRLDTILALLVGLVLDPKEAQPYVDCWLDAAKYRRSRDDGFKLEILGNVEAPLNFSLILNALDTDEWTMEEDVELVPIEAFNDPDFADYGIVPNLVLGQSTGFTSSRIYQFTTATDPLYIEGTLGIVASKIYLVLCCENNSSQILQNIRIELCAGEHLEPMSTVPVHTLDCGASFTCQVQFRIKSSSDDHICGHVYFDKTKAGIQKCIMFNPMKVCMFDYIAPDFMTPAEFRKQWNELEWEKRVPLGNIKMQPLEFMKVLLKHTHGTVVAPLPPNWLKQKAATAVDNWDEYVETYMEYLSGLDQMAPFNQSSAFCALNIFLRTIYDEEALANLNLVCNSGNGKGGDLAPPKGEYSGSLKIRSRRQASCYTSID